MAKTHFGINYFLLLFPNTLFFPTVQHGDPVTTIKAVPSLLLFLGPGY